MIGHLLGDFELPSVFQMLRVPRSPKAVATDSRLQTGVGGMPPDPPVDISLCHLLFCECAGAAVGRPQEISLEIARNPRRFSVGMQVFLKLLVTGHLVEAEPHSAPLDIDILDPDPAHSHPGKRVCHDGHQGTIPKAHDGSVVDHVKECLGLASIHYGRFALFDRGCREFGLQPLDISGHVDRADFP